MHCTTVGWLIVLVVAVAGYCLYRRWQVRRYRRAKQAALDALLPLDISRPKT